MSTRSNIALFDTGNGSVTSIYSHYDGYPEGVGATLLAHYQDAARVAELLALGDISVLGAHIAPAPGVPHTFEHRADNVTIAYHRDREDKWASVKPREHCSLGLWLADCLSDPWYEHLYLFKDAAWYHINTEAMRAHLVAELKPLELAA